MTETAGSTEIVIDQGRYSLAELGRMLRRHVEEAGADICDIVGIENPKTVLLEDQDAEDLFHELMIRGQASKGFCAMSPREAGIALAEVFAPAVSALDRAEILEGAGLAPMLERVESALDAGEAARAAELLDTFLRPRSRARCRPGGALEASR